MTMEKKRKIPIDVVDITWEPAGKAGIGKVTGAVIGGTLLVPRPTVTRERFKEIWFKWSGYDGPYNRITYGDLEELLEKEFNIVVDQEVKGEPNDQA